MRYREYPPGLLLSTYASCFWEISPGSGPQRILPDGAMDVLFAEGEAQARVIGPMTRAIVTPASVGTWTVGVRFLPGAASALLGIAARELVDESAGVADVWGVTGRGLEGRLGEASTPSLALRVLARDLRERARRASAPDLRILRAVETLRRAHGELPIPAVAARAGVGERQLERLFDELVGYGPKAFGRIARMQRAVAAIQHGRRLSWAQLARDCGYTDQAHLIRQFQALVGATPGQYALGRAVSEIDNPRLVSPASFSP